MDFLREKLNLPIPAELSLEEISSKYSNFALGLDELSAKQVLNFQELSVSPGQSSGIFVIRFKSITNYSGVLHAVFNGLKMRNRNPAHIRFICVDENYQPFAYAYFIDSTWKGGSSPELNILVWTQDNTNIHISTEHDIPESFLPDESKDDEIVTTISPENLLAKIQSIGSPLSTKLNVYQGVTTGCNQAYVIDESQRTKLINKHPNSAEILKLGIGKHQEHRWKPSYKTLIWIPSSKNKNWPWSEIEEEAEAERIFEMTYPAIHSYLIKNIFDIKSRAKGSKGEYYWELSLRDHYEQFLGPKIIIYKKPPIMAFYDESDAIVINPYVHCIPTSDLSLLAILNSTLFEWYVQTKFETKGEGRLNKTNLGNFPISGTEAQKMQISELVKQLLSNPAMSDVTELEEKIDILVYNMYKLTDADIDFIKDSQHIHDKSVSSKV